MKVGNERQWKESPTQIPGLYTESPEHLETFPQPLRISIQKAKMTENNEKTILQEGNVKITNLRLLIGTETYGISNIRAVNLSRQARNKRPLLLIPIGILLALWAAVTDAQFMEFFNIGVVLVIAGASIFLFVKPPYTIHIETPSHKFGILNTADLSLTKRIIDAMNLAIAGNRKT
jgi:hypothetical protein